MLRSDRHRIYRYFTLLTQSQYKFTFIHSFCDQLKLCSIVFLIESSDAKEFWWGTKMVGNFKHRCCVNKKCVIICHFGLFSTLNGTHNIWVAKILNYWIEVFFFNINKTIGKRIKICQKMWQRECIQRQRIIRYDLQQYLCYIPCA